MGQTKLVTLSGSLRAESVNRKLLAEAVRLFGPAEVIDGDIRFPLYDGDLEDSDGVPESVQTLAQQIVEADGVIISTPEYNQSLSGVLKNALDWISRTGLGPWKDKPVVIMSAAAGRAGGARAQYALRLALNAFGPRLLTGPEVMLANAGNEFDDDGRITAERTEKMLAGMMDRLKAEIARG